ncbi:Uncharacterised protein [Myroides odoratus]|nr:hypothetical protein HMPREF9716_03324 [Myroides odoratus CIP 103059]STZ30872.1 Uncharacterised protein [Myroides odoratus]
MSIALYLNLDIEQLYLSSSNSKGTISFILFVLSLKCHLLLFQSYHYHDSFPKTWIPFHLKRVKNNYKRNKQVYPYSSPINLSYGVLELISNSYFFTASNFSKRSFVSSISFFKNTISVRCCPSSSSCSITCKYNSSIFSKL